MALSRKQADQVADERYRMGIRAGEGSVRADLEAEEIRLKALVERNQERQDRRRQGR